jgi:hypothetical protein
MKRESIIIRYVFILPLLLACGFLQRISPAVTPGATLTPAPTSTPADTMAPTLRSVTPGVTVVKNGDVLRIVVETGEEGLTISADVSALDSTHPSPLIFLDQGNGHYLGTLTVSYGNAAENGIKPIVVSATDPAGKAAQQVVEITLANPAPVLDKNPPNDSFDGSTLDRAKWNYFIDNGGSIRVEDGRLVTITDQNPSFSRAMIQSTWVFTGDFDIQVDFHAGPDWDSPPSGYINAAALGVIVEGRHFNITLVKRGYADGGPSNQFLAWKDSNPVSPEMANPAQSGKYRLIRNGTLLINLYDIGEGWQELGILAIPASPATVYIGSNSVDASFAFSTYFDNFIINSGLTGQ